MSGPGSLARIRTCGSSLADAMSSMMATVEIKSVRLTGLSKPSLLGNIGIGVDVTSTSGVS